MSESEPKVKTVWVCPSCGWVRPKGFSSHNCGKCNATLMPKIVKEDCELNPAHYIKGYTEEYKNRNWRKCRYGHDLRDCPGYYTMKHSLETKTGGEWLIYVTYCKADNKPCDAKWMGDKDE